MDVIRCSWNPKYLIWFVNSCQNNRVWKSTRRKLAQFRTTVVRCNRIEPCDFFASICDCCSIKASVVRYCDRIARKTRWSDDRTCADVNQRGIYIADVRPSSVEIIECKRRFMYRQRWRKLQPKSRPIMAWNRYAYTVYTVHV